MLGGLPRSVLPVAIGFVAAATVAATTALSPGDPSAVAKSSFLSRAGSTITANGTAVRVLGYNILGTNDLLKRTGGASPFENRNVTYTGLGALDAAVNAGVDRFAGDSRAFTYLKNFYQPTGQLQTKVLTLHTTLDSDVPFAHEASLAAIVAKAGVSGKLVQQSYNRYGHCNFSPAEAASAFFRLADWVKRGVKPVGGALAP